MRRKKNEQRKQKKCPFKASKWEDIDYKQVDVLKCFTTEYGKILPRRITGVSAKFHRKLEKAIMRARQVALLPFVKID